MTRDGNGIAWGRAAHFDTGATTVHPDHRNTLDLDTADLLALMSDIPHDCNKTTQRIVDWLDGASRVRLEIPTGTATMGNGFAAAFAPAFAPGPDDPDEDPA